LVGLNKVPLKIFVDEKADGCPPDNDATSGIGAPHPYSVLLGIILPAVVGVTAKEVPVQIGLVVKLVIAGVGSTNTVTVN
jgi:hypothetical protein